jgi:hypothetical protein
MPEPKDELNKEEKVLPDGGVQPPKENKPLTPEEIEAIRVENAKLKEDLAKAEEEKGNYKQGLISKKAKEDELLFGDEEIEDKKPLAPITPPEKTDDEKAWEEIDRRSEEKAQKVLADRDKKEARMNELIAKKEWMKSHPELISNDALRQAIYGEYYPKHGKSVEGIKLDLDRAYNVYKIDNNIPLATENKNKVDFPNLPNGAGGNGAGLKKTSISAQEQAIKDKFGISDESWGKYKNDVLSGKRQAPPEVLQILQEEE